jgi:hypothetical protein
VRAAWTGAHDMRGFREAFTKLQKLVARLGVARVLLDLNALPDISVYDQLWLSTVFMPSILVLPLRQVVVALSPKNIYNHQAVEGLLLAVHLLIRFDMQFFAQPDAGMQWLTDYSPRLVDLQREWSQQRGATPPQSDEVAECRPGYQRRKVSRLPS